jgi:hypothetical protein
MLYWYLPQLHILFATLHHPDSCAPLVSSFSKTIPSETRLKQDNRSSQGDTCNGTNVSRRRHASRRQVHRRCHLVVMFKDTRTLRSVRSSDEFAIHSKQADQTITCSLGGDAAGGGCDACGPTCVSAVVAAHCACQGSRKGGCGQPQRAGLVHVDFAGGCDCVLNAAQRIVGYGSKESAS